MSAPRRLLAWLWAAVWLRWRLTRVKAARSFGGRRVGIAGPDYHLVPVETPVEGLDYDPTELPAEMIAKLELTRAELRRRQPQLARPAISRGARRRRVASLATAGLLAAGAAGAAAGALVTGSTGVPGVDRVLGIYEAGRESPDDVRARANGVNIFIGVPGTGPRGLVSSSYVAGDGRICTALARADADAPILVRAVTCLTPSSLASYLTLDDGVAVAVNTVGVRAVIRGYVSDRVAELSGDGPNGPLEVHLGRKWVPDVSGIGALRSFVALGDVSLAGGADRADPLRSGDLGNYVFDAVTDDGERIRIERNRAP